MPELPWLVRGGLSPSPSSVTTCRVHREALWRCSAGYSIREGARVCLDPDLYPGREDAFNRC